MFFDHAIGWLVIGTCALILISAIVSGARGKFKL